MGNRDVRSGSAHTKTRELVKIGLSIALIYVATLINVEIPTIHGGGLVHLGTLMSFIIIMIFGRKTGTVAGATAMGMYDVFSKFTIWAPTTIITRLIMGYIMGTIVTKDGEAGMSFSRNLVAIIVGGMILVAGYYIGEGLTFGNWITPVSSVPVNIAQVVMGGIGSLMAVPLLKRKQIQ